MEAKILEHVRVDEFETKLMYWEEVVTMYNGLGTTQVPDDIKRAILIRTAPTEVRTHLQVNAGTIRTYQEMRDMIESFLRAKNVWKAKPGASVGGDPMEIGGIESKCSNCGKKGHDISQCWKKGGGAYDAYSKGKGKAPEAGKSGKGKGSDKGGDKGKSKGKSKDSWSSNASWASSAWSPSTWSAGKDKGKGGGKGCSARQFSGSRRSQLHKLENQGNP